MDTDVMSITGAYFGMQQAKLQGDVQTSILRKAMDQETQSAQKLLEIMPGAPNLPHQGSAIDRYV